MASAVTLDARSYPLRAAERAAVAAYALAQNGGQIPRDSFAVALSAWWKFQLDDEVLEVDENVVPIVLAVLDLDETDRAWLPARSE